MSFMSKAILAGARPLSPLSINGVPLPILLHHLNAKRGLPMGGKLRTKPLEKKGTPGRLDGDRAEVKAVQREHASQAHHEQRAYENGFKRMLGWSWRRVEKELLHRKMSWSGLALLAAEVGLVIEAVAKQAA